MDNSFFLTYKIGDRSYVPFIKREIHNLVHSSGFTSQRIGEIDIIISELTSNLIKFAESGDLLYRLGSDQNGDFFEVLCMDSGQGIVNLSRMIQDGMSTSDTLGQGLGAISRLSSLSAIYTSAGWGTIIHSKVYKSGVKVVPEQHKVDFAAVQVCFPGENICGDGFYVKKMPNGMQFFMGDGLGHGKHADEAVTEAINVFRRCDRTSPADVLKFIHESCKKTRGLVATVAFLDFHSRKWMMCGIGNISTSLYSGLVCKNYTPHNGILGHNIPRTLTDSVLEAERHQTLIMHSDGLRTRWKLADYIGILRYGPQMMSAVLYKDNARHNDDMTVLVAKLNI